MDLFTYLMAKNDHNSSVHGDLFSYLLGKAQGGGGQIKTASGITIYIPDATKTGIVSFMMTKESTQDTTTGKNLAQTLNGIWYNTNGNLFYSLNQGYGFKANILPNTTYTISQKNPGNRFAVLLSENEIVVNNTFRQLIIADSSGTRTTFTFTTGETDKYVLFLCYRGTDTQAQELACEEVQIEEGSTATPYEEYTGGIPSPNPDFPQEVNVVEGYRNLFDKDNANIKNGLFINANNLIYSTGTSGINTLYINIQPNKKYSISKISSNVFRVATSVNIPAHNGLITNAVANNTGTFITITSGTNDNYLAVSYYQSTTDTLTEQEILDSVMIVEGDQELSYVPYGNNYIAVNVSNGTNTNKYPIPLNNNIIAGIGDYKDELKVDKSGNVFINKKTGKIILDGSENWSKANASDGNRFLCSIIRDKVKIPASTSTIADILCDRFISESANDTNSSINGMGIASSGNIVFYYDVIKNYTTTQTKEWFSLNNTEVYYVLATPELIDLQTTVDLKLFKGVNNISNSEDGYMTIEYK